MQVLLYFARNYRWQSAVMVLCLLAATIAQALGLTTVFPLLRVATGSHDARDPSRFDGIVRDLLARLDVAHLGAHREAESAISCHFPHQM